MTATERTLLDECRQIAARDGYQVRQVLVDAERYWRGPGRLVEPRRWRARAEACRRLLDRADYLTGEGRR
jgi:hypothetical protein